MEWEGQGDKLPQHYSQSIDVAALIKILASVHLTTDTTLLQNEKKSHYMKHAVSATFPSRIDSQSCGQTAQTNSALALATLRSHTCIINQKYAQCIKKSKQAIQFFPAKLQI